MLNLEGQDVPSCAAIKQDMQKKGIEKNLQTKVLASFSHDEQMELAMELAQKAVRTNENKTPAQVKQKIQDVLLRKGYSYTVVTEILEQIKLERKEDEWSTLIESQGEKIWRKYSSKFEGFELNQKVKQSLYQKGFPIDIITEFIEQKEQQQNE